MNNPGFWRLNMIRIDRENKIATSSLIILAGFALSVVYHYVEGIYKGLGYPYDTFLFKPNDRWADFIKLVNISHNPYSVIRGWSNFPFLYRFAWLFSFGHLNLLVKVYLLLFAGFFAYICWKNVKTPHPMDTVKNVFIFAFLSYPFLFSIDRANFEIVAFACLYGYFNLYHKHSMIASIFLALAVALKVYPAILALLFLTDKKYKEFFLAAGLSFFLTIASYAILPGGLVANIKGNFNNITAYNKSYAVFNGGLPFGNSLFGAIKFVVFWVKPGLTFNPATIVFIGGALPYYYIFTGFVLLGLFAYVVFVEKSFWKKAAIFVCALNLLPTVSGDYKLLHLFIVLFLLINETEHNPWDWLYILLLSLVMIPKDYFRLLAEPEVSLSVLVNPLLMLLLITVIIGTGLQEYHHVRVAARNNSERVSIT